MSSNSTNSSSVGPRSVRRLALILTAGLALSLPIGGCDQEDASAQAISKAKLELQGLVPGSLQPPSTSYRSKVYNDVVATLKPVANQGNKSQTAAASLLLSQAQAGLAEAPAAEASLLEREALNRIMGIQSELGEWYSLNAQADGAASYDPTEELGAIDKLVKERQDQRVAAQNQKSKVDAEVAQLRDQAKTKVEQARAKQEEAGTLRAKVANQTAVQGEETLKQAQVIGRQADALEVEGSMLEAQAAKIAPQSGAIQLEIDRLTNQLGLLDAARADVQTRAQTASANAGASRASATKASNAITSQLAELEALRSGDLEQKSTAAVNGYQTAASEAARAIGESRANAQIAVGSARQSLGDVYWSKAHGLASYATLLETLGNAQPPLPGSKEHSVKAAEVRAAAKAALDAATEAYEAADAGYKSSGNAQAAERIERVNAMLAKIVDKTSGGSKDIRNPVSEGGDAGSAPSEGGAAAADGPAGTIDAIVSAVKAGRIASAVDHLHVTDPANRQILNNIASVADKVMAFNSAVKAKFGKSLLELAMSAGGAGGPDAMAMMGAAGMPDLSQIQNISASDFRIEQNGDTADVYPPGESSQPAKMRKIDGRWVLDLSEAEQQISAMPQAAQYKQLIAFALPKVGKAFDELKSELDSNAYSSPELLMTGLMVKFQPLGMELAQMAQQLGIQMPPMGPGGG